MILSIYWNNTQWILFTRSFIKIVLNFHFIWINLFQLDWFRLWNRTFKTYFLFDLSTTLTYFICFIHLSKLLFFFQKLFQVVVRIKLYLIFKVPIFRFYLISMSFSFFLSIYSGQKPSAPFLYNYNCLCFLLLFNFLLSLQLFFYI